MLNFVLSVGGEFPSKTVKEAGEQQRATGIRVKPKLNISYFLLPIAWNAGWFRRFLYCTGHFCHAAVPIQKSISLSRPKSFSLNLTFSESKNNHQAFCASFVCFTNEFPTMCLYVIFNCLARSHSRAPFSCVSLPIYVFLFNCNITIRADDGKMWNGLHERITATCSH